VSIKAMITQGPVVLNSFPAEPRVSIVLQGLTSSHPSFWGGSCTYSQSVIAKKASEATGAILQGEGLLIGVVGGGLAGVVAGM
jgi:hypothetical protein